MENFTPFSAISGGILIGLSAVLLMALFGRIAGISGIYSSAILSSGVDSTWRLAFLTGLICAPLPFIAITGTAPAVMLEAKYPTIIIAGLLVGYGTKLGSGCTSGHGVCGLSRLSPRSFVSVLLFMTSGMLTVFLLRSISGT